jgi:RNA polymerase sigma-70 factor, ECF subfamily
LLEPGIDLGNIGWRRPSLPGRTVSLSAHFCYGFAFLLRLFRRRFYDARCIGSCAKLCVPIQGGLAFVLREGKAELPGADLKEASRDARLILAIRSGSEQAMEELYDLYSSLVYSVALRVLRDTGAAEDILQEVFMQLWRAPSAFDSSRGSLPAWLSVIARNRAIDSLRRRRPEEDWSDVIVSVEPDLTGDAERNRSIEKVRDTLSGMPAAQRSALEMAFFDGLTHREIASKIGDPLGTVKTRIRTGLLALRRALST